MRVITWNMGMAGVAHRKPGLHDQAWHYLLGLGPDLALLQETLPPPWARGEGTVIQGGFRRWGSALFAPRFPLERFRLPEGTRLRELGSYLEYGVASLPDGTSAFVASVHAVDRKATPRQLGSLEPAALARSSNGPRVNDVVFAGIADLVGDRFIVGGDWNTGRGQASEASRKAGEAFFARVRGRDWYDCVWDKLGEEVQTWFREGDHLRQNDHIFCDRILGDKLQEVRVASEAVTDLGLSDHAPLILDFEVGSIAMADLAE